MKKNFYLFDIDGTLVNINHIHLGAYKSTYKKILKQDIPDNVIISTFGMSETEAYQSIFKYLKQPYDQKIADKLLVEQPNTLCHLLRTIRIKPIPGVIDCLTNLRKNKNNFLGIVTGNLSKPADMILKQSGLKHYFKFISTDTGNLKRVQIVQNAIRLAKQKHSIGKIIVIGDTTNDIKAGKAAGAYTIGVATGSCSKAQLRKVKPDKIWDSLHELKSAQKYINRA